VASWRILSSDATKLHQNGSYAATLSLEVEEGAWESKEPDIEE
jgi:hypothetical protein